MSTEQNWIDNAVKEYYSSIETDLTNNMSNDNFRVTYKYLCYALADHVDDIWMLYQRVRKIKDVFLILKQKKILLNFVKYQNFRLWFNNAYEREKILLVRKNVNVNFNSLVAKNTHYCTDVFDDNNDDVKKADHQSNSNVSNLNGIEVPIIRQQKDFPEAYLPKHLYHLSSGDPRYPEFFPERITDKDGNRCRWLAKVDWLLIDDDGYLYIPEEQLPLPFNLSPTYDAGLYQKADRAEFFDVEKIKALIRKASTKVPDGIFKGRKISL